MAHRFSSPHSFCTLVGSFSTGFLAHSKVLAARSYSVRCLSKHVNLLPTLLYCVTVTLTWINIQVWLCVMNRWPFYHIPRRHFKLFYMKMRPEKPVRWFEEVCLSFRNHLFFKHETFTDFVQNIISKDSENLETSTWASGPKAARLQKQSSNPAWTQEHFQKS